MKLVSVIIPVYNVERYIGLAVQSVLNQIYKNWELLIVDDGSSDKSIDICLGFGDPRIKIIRQENRGVCAARNMGIRHSRGEYLAFLDGDDLWLPDKLSKHVRHLENSPTVGVSFSQSAFIDENGKPLGIYQMPQLQKITPSLVLCRNPVSNGSTPVIRREVIDGIKFTKCYENSVVDCYFDEEFSHFEDVECWLRITLQTQWKLEGIPEALTLYRINSIGASTNSAKQLQDVRKVLKKTYSYAPSLVVKHGREAEAIQIRKLARWAIRLRDGRAAVRLSNEALLVYWKIILKDPIRTLTTVISSYLLYLMPRSLYVKIELVAISVVGTLQRRKVSGIDSNVDKKTALS